MKKIYIFIDEFNRDSVVGAALERYFKDLNMDVYFGNRTVLGYFSKFQSPFDFHIFPSISFFSEFAEKLKDGTVGILPSESICSTSDTESRLAFHLFSCGPNSLQIDKNLIQRKIAFYFLWGVSHAEIAKKFIPEAIHKIKVIGHPRHDALCQKNITKDSSNVLRVLGVVTRYDFLNPFDMRPQLPLIASLRRGYEGIGSYYHSEGYDVEDIWHNQVCDFNNTLSIISEAERLGIKVSIRVHPRENFSQWRVVLSNRPVGTSLADPKMPFSHWLRQVDAVIAPPSTSFYDCALMNKCCVNIANLNPKRKLHAAPNSDDSDRILDFYPRPSTVEGVLSELRKLSKPNMTPEFFSCLEDEVGFSSRHDSLKTTSITIASYLNERVKERGRWDELKFNAYCQLKTLIVNCNKAKQNSAYWPLDNKHKAQIRAIIN